MFFPAYMHACIHSMQLGEEVRGAQWLRHSPQYPQILLCGNLSREGRHLEKNPAPVCAQPQGIHEQHCKLLRQLPLHWSLSLGKLCFLESAAF